ncbi:MAG: hypothetical protein ACYDFT_03040, partial [Thermoplasmata archaeon]
PTGEAGSGLPETVLLEIEEHLKARETRRDLLYERARSLRRRAQGVMQRIHGAGAPPEQFEELRSDLRALGRAADGPLGADASVVQDALQEAVEALLLGAVVAGTAPPTPAGLGVPPEVYLLGLGDLIGEIRRLVLRALAEERTEEALGLLNLMETYYQQLLRFEAPRRIVALKPKQDTARALLERTRGEVTLGLLLARVRTRGGADG